MRVRYAYISLWLTLSACVGKHLEGSVPEHGFRGMEEVDAAHAHAIQDSVRSFMRAVAGTVTASGPDAWLLTFSQTPAFFMGADGYLAFPSFDSAARFLRVYARRTPKIELTWGNNIRVDPLAPGLAVVGTEYQERQTDSAGHEAFDSGFFTGVVEHTSHGWQLRDAHWSHKEIPRVSALLDNRRAVFFTDACPAAVAGGC